MRRYTVRGAKKKEFKNKGDEKQTLILRSQER